ncbi:MAG: hypothetical protein ACI4S2_00280 [Lachnospiraceae bacterium]
MFDFLKFYLGYEVGFKIGKKLPGALRAICKGFALLISIALWASSFDGGVPFDRTLGIGIRVLTIIYCIIVWGCIVGIEVLKVLDVRGIYKLPDMLRKMNLIRIYYWVILVLSLIVEVLNMGEISALGIVLGILYGYFLVHFPMFILTLADSVVGKAIKLKK